MKEVFKPSIDQQKMSAEELTKLKTTEIHKLGITVPKQLQNYDE